MDKIDRMELEYRHFQKYGIRVSASEALNDVICDYILQYKKYNGHRVRMAETLHDLLQRYLNLTSEPVKKLYVEQFFGSKFEDVTDEEVKNYVELLNLCS